MTDSPVTEGQILAGKYRVERVLGSGGMGVVVAAWHLELEQRVAVKFLHPLAMERADTAERFRREARSAAKIRSEHVARVIDVGIMDGGVPYMVMEYLEGHDISEELQKYGMLPIDDSVDFVLQAIEALAEAHAAGIVHRDLKPANLFIATRADGTRIVKVLDFGISKSLLGGSVAEMSLTRTSTLIGSPLYMSPEQMRSAKDVDTRTDIWSLGVILYEMLTGCSPYTGDSIPALCASLLSDTPPSLRSLRAAVPEELEDVVMHCLAKNRDERFATVSELARALAPYGSSSSQVHVDRASRVLGVTDISPSSLHMSSERMSNADRSGGHRAPHALSTTPLRGSRPTPTPTPPIRRTVDSWGRTDAPNQNTREPKRSRKPLFIGLALAAAALVTVVLLVGIRAPSAQASASASVAAPPAAPVPIRLQEPEQTPVPQVLPSTAAPDPSAPVVRPQDSAAKAKPAAVGLVAKPKFAAAPKAAPASDLSDFGGRR
ncbi:MAG: serine/threonine-protein kinase [Polyangiaceae bacterium]